MAPHIIKLNCFEIIAKKVQNILSEISSERFSKNLYVVLQVVIWMLISSFATYYLIKIKI